MARVRRSLTEGNGSLADRKAAAELVLKRLQGGRIARAIQNMTIFAKKVTNNPGDEVSIDLLGEEYAYAKQFLDELWSEAIVPLTKTLGN